MRFPIIIALFVCISGISQEIGVTSFSITADEEGLPEIFFRDPFRIVSASGLPEFSFRNLRVDPSNYWQAVDMVAAAEREQARRDYLASLQPEYSAEKYGFSPRRKKDPNRVEFGVRPTTYGLDRYRYADRYRGIHPLMLYRPYYIVPHVD